MGESNKYPNLVVSGLELVDDAGRRRASLQLYDNEMPNLRLYDANRCERIVIGLGKKDSPHFAMLDQTAKTLIGIEVFEDGDAGIAIHDSTGKPAVYLQSSKSDGGSAAIFNADGECVWQVSFNPKTTPGDGP